MEQDRVYGVRKEKNGEQDCGEKVGKTEKNKSSQEKKSEKDGEAVVVGRRKRQSWTKKTRINMLCS